MFGPQTTQITQMFWAADNTDHTDVLGHRQHGSHRCFGRRQHRSHRCSWPRQHRSPEAL